MLLDVGSGSHPHPRAEVTCDLYFNAEFEGGAIRAREQRNFVICDAQYLPFKDQAFKESNCTHVLEHLKDPCLGFSELKRVSIKGYIETPSTLYENVLFGYPFHYWVFIKKKGEVYFSKSKKLNVNGRTIIPFGWFLHKLTLHERLARIVIPVRKIPFFYIHHRWSR